MTKVDINKKIQNVAVKKITLYNYYITWCIVDYRLIHKFTKCKRFWHIYISTLSSANNELTWFVKRSVKEGLTESNPGSKKI